MNRDIKNHRLRLAFKYNDYLRSVAEKVRSENDLKWRLY